MLRSLFAGISGLRSHQTMMDVVGNNIANINTTGYKSSAVLFQDTLSQTLKGAGAPGSAATGGLAGTNPMQIGLGVQVGGVLANFTQGSAQATGRSTDLMIQGDGFFVVNNGSENFYTRAGGFTFDTDGRLASNDGMVVQGWMGVEGVVDTNAPVAPIQIPSGTILPPVATSEVTISGNLGTDMILNDTATATATVYDTAGVKHAITATLTRTTAVGVSPAIYTVALSEGATAIASTTAGTVSFDAAGEISAVTDAVATIGGAVVTFNLGEPPAGAVPSTEIGLRMYGGKPSVGVSASNGSSAATLNGFQISPEGSITGVFSNGLKQNMGVLAMANFTNPMGLEKVGNTSFRDTTNSGLPQIGTANTGGRGGFLSNNLEMSNVDLGAEFTNLIIAQRGFQANSRVITSSDEMLQDLVSIKR